MGSKESNQTNKISNQAPALAGDIWANVQCFYFFISTFPLIVRKIVGIKGRRQQYGHSGCPIFWSKRFYFTAKYDFFVRVIISGSSRLTFFA